MMQTPNVPVLQLVTQERVSFGRAPVALVGNPRHCTGLLLIHNPHAHPIKLRRVRLRSDERALINTCEPTGLEIKLAAKLCAEQTQRLRVKLELPAGTPPGCYQAHIEGLEGEALPVSIHVLEDRRLRLWPGAMTHGTRAGETFTVHVTATNLGNVPVVIPAGIVMELHPADRDWHAHFHAAAKTHGDQGYAAFLDAFVKGMGADEPALGRAKIVDGVGTLAPQDGRLLELAVTMPKKLRNGRKYRALLRIAGAQLDIILHVGQVANEPETDIDETTSTAG